MFQAPKYELKHDLNVLPQWPIVVAIRPKQAAILWTGY